MDAPPFPSPETFGRAPLPSRFCNLDRLLHAMKARGLDGIVATTPRNMFYLTGFNGIAHKSDEPRPYAMILSRHAPEHPIAVLADYYLATFLTQPSWVEDIRPFRAVMMPLDLPPRRADIDRFIPEHGGSAPWLANARKRYAFDMASAMRGALTDLALDRGRVGFDDMGFGCRLDVDGMEVADAYDALMFARAVKTATEMRLIERATALNEAAIRRTMASWQKGATWRDLNKAYARAVTELGGFVRDPGAMVWGHPRGADPALTLATGLEDDEVEPGTHVLFDCHGTIDLYCWDGGKTWVVEGEPEGAAKRFAEATARVAEMLISAMRPGVRIGELSDEAGTSIAARACPIRTPPSSSFTASAFRTWISSKPRPTANRILTGCSTTAWSRRCTCSIPAASTSACGSKRWWRSGPMAAARCSPGVLAR